MSFFGKLKQGVSEASQKAKTTVEVNRLKLQVQSKQGAIKEKYALIGSRVFKKIEKNEPLDTDEEIKQHCEEIVHIREEIKDIQVRLRELNEEKDCVCGNVVGLNDRFCPACGHKFEERDVVEPQTAELQEGDIQQIVQAEDDASKESDLQAAVCPSCQEAVLHGAKFCGGCGQPLT